MAKTKTINNKTSNHANIGFEAELFKAADLLRANMEPSDYNLVWPGSKYFK